jgi:hypothetical protein
MVFPVRRISVASVRRKSGRTSAGKLLGKLDAASERLARARSRR